MPETAGELVASNGEVIGRHEGISNFTVGQRKGLGVSFALAALCPQDRPRQPSRHRRRRRRTGHAHPARPPPQLDQHSRAHRPHARARSRSAIATSPPGPRSNQPHSRSRRSSWSDGRSPRHLRRAPARRHPRPVRRLLRRRRSRRRRLDRLGLLSREFGSKTKNNAVILSEASRRTCGLGISTYALNCRDAPSAPPAPVPNGKRNIQSRRT